MVKPTLKIIEEYFAKYYPNGKPPRMRDYAIRADNRYLKVHVSARGVIKFHGSYFDEALTEPYVKPNFDPTKPR